MKIMVIVESNENSTSFSQSLGFGWEQICQIRNFNYSFKHSRRLVKQNYKQRCEGSHIQQGVRDIIC